MIQQIVLSYIARFAYIGIFGSMMLGMIGLPIPDELLMTFAGYLVFKGKLNYWLTVLTASVGAVSGVSFSFFLGNKLGLPLLTKYGRKIHFSPDRLKKSEQFFQRFGKISVTVGYFIPGVRHLTALSAGINKWHYRTFLIYAIPGGFVWAFTFVTLGMYLGEKWLPFIETFHKDSLFFVIGVVALIGIWWVLHHGQIGRMKAK